MGTPRLLIVFTAATVGVLLIMYALATGSWWALLPAVLAHGFGFAVATGVIMGALNEGTKPSPVEETREQVEAASSRGEHTKPL